MSIATRHRGAAQAAVVAAVLAVSGCGSPPAVSPFSTPTTSLRTAEPAAGPPSATAATGPGLVAVIVMENHSPEQVLGEPYLHGLAARGAVLQDYRAVGHPSLPNYLALTSGSTWGIDDDGYHRLPAGRDLGAQLTAAAVPWRAYMEGLTGGCLDSPYPYAIKHNPFAYYGGGCPANVVPLESLAGDLHSAAPPAFVWITPGLCSDDHDCAPSSGDAFLARTVPMLLAAPGFARHGLVALVWDEGGDDADHSTAVLLSPDLVAPASAARYDHYSLLAAVEDRFGLPRLGAAAGADALTALLRRG